MLLVIFSRNVTSGIVRTIIPQMQVLSSEGHVLYNHCVTAFHESYVLTFIYIGSLQYYSLKPSIKAVDMKQEAMVGHC